MTDITPDQVPEIMRLKARANPHAVYNQMREESRVSAVVGPMTGLTYYFVNRYDDAVAALKNPDIGKNVEEHFTPEMLEKFPPENPMTSMVNDNMLFVDPPDHTRLRSLVHKAFTPRIIASMEPRIQQIADDLIDSIQGKDEIDFISEFALPIPITVIAELLGVPVSDQEKFRRWSNDLVYWVDEAQTMQAAMEFIAYFHDMFDKRREDPQDDLITNLVQVEEDGDKLDGEELMGMVFLLLVAGHETTVNLIGNGTLELIRHPEQMQKLRANPDLIKSAVEEMLRYNGPIECATDRYAFKDIHFGDEVIPFGSPIFVSLHGANRDPRQFENPDVFDITRQNNKHIAFGHGIHYCLGAPLARMEATIAFGRLLNALERDTIKTIELNADIDDLRWTESLLIHGIKSMPVKIGV